MKKLLIFTAVLTLALGLLCTTAQAAENIKVTVDGKTIAFTDAKPFIDSNYRTQVPMRALGEALGCQVNYAKNVVNGDGHENINLIKNTENGLIWRADLNRWHYTYPYPTAQWGNVITVDVFSSMMSDFNIRYQTNPLDTTPQMKNNRTYLPARYVAEAFGYSVNWDSKTSTVIIKTDPTNAFHIAGSEGLTATDLQGNWQISQRSDTLSITDNTVKIYGGNHIIKNRNFDPSTGAAYLDLGNNVGISILLESKNSATVQYCGQFDADIFYITK